MFSWLLGKKNRAAAASALAEAPEAAPLAEAATLEADAVLEPVAEAAPVEAEPVPEPMAEAALVEAETVPEPIAEAETVESEAVPEPVAEAAPVESEPVPEPMAEAALVEAETVPEPVAEAETVEAAPVERETVPGPIVEAAPIEAEPVPEPVAEAVTEPVAEAVPEPVAEAVTDPSAVATWRRPAGLMPLRKMDAILQPAPGMIVALRYGRSLMPATVDDVSASGRRILVALPGTGLRRPYTRRLDGCYRLEGAPDNSHPVIEIREPGSSGRIGSRGIQRCKPLRYVKRRRSPSVNFLHGGRRAARARDKAADFGHGSKTGRRPVTTAPIRTPKRSKVRSRMPSSSR